MQRLKISIADLPSHLSNEERLKQWLDLVCAQLDDSHPAMTHLRRYIEMLVEADELSGDPALMRHVETTIQDLLALALGESGEAGELVKLRGLRAARHAEIIREIGANFADPAISVQRVAARLGVSASYVQKLLRDTGSNFSERVLELRLQKACRMLTDPRHDQLKVSDIALACGFNEISYFNRCFRRRFGDSPLGYRGRAG